MDTGRIRLKAKVKGLAEAGRWARRQINKTEKELRSEWWGAKRSVGCDARTHLVAYGLLRGLPYGAVERRCGEQNAPVAEAVHAAVQAHGDWRQRREWTLEKVKEWLSPDAQRAWAESHPEPVRVKPPYAQRREAQEAAP